MRIHSIMIGFFLAIFIGITSINCVCFAQGSRHQSPLMMQRWENYVTSMKTQPLQKGCEPTYFQASEKNTQGKAIQFKGTVILYHGFTACPQQYFEWATQYLNKEGFDVFLPLLPGHGRAWTGKSNAENNISGLPTRINWKAKYSQFVHEMNQIMTYASGIRVVGGLSVGGEAAISSVTLSDGIYDRVLLLSPFLKVSDENAKSSKGFFWSDLLRSLQEDLQEIKISMIDLVSTPQNPLYSVSLKTQSWGATCEGLERKGGRAGYCQFSLNAVSANQKLGQKIIDDSLHFKHFPLVQIVSVENDPVASIATVKAWKENIDQSSPSTSSMCVMPTGVNHSMLSRFDSPKENKYWLNPLLKSITLFVSEGQIISNKDKISKDEGVPFCEM